MPRLDRLSALLAGLAADVRVRHAGPLPTPLGHAGGRVDELDLNVVVSGRICIDDGHSLRDVEAPGAMITVAREPYRLLPETAAESIGVNGAGRTGGNGRLPQLLSASARLSGPAGAALLEAFAQPMILCLDAGSEELVHLLALIRSELDQPRCGHAALLSRVGEILLITLLRHIIARPGLGSGLLSALADPRIARALVALHERPAAPWSLEAMAETAGMSRTAFAENFRARMGITPGNYLGRLRLGIAEQAVLAGSGLKRAARAAGYASPSALSRALSRSRLAAGQR